MNTHIELRKAIAAWEAIACKRKVSWRHILLRIYKDKRLPGEVSISWKSGNCVCHPAGGGRSVRKAIFDLTQTYRELVDSHPAFEASMDRAIAIKEAEIRSYGIDPSTLSGYRLFGKFDPEDPMGVKDMEP